MPTYRAVTGDMLLCNRPDTGEHKLTRGKQYRAQNVANHFVSVLDDRGVLTNWYLDRFDVVLSPIQSIKHKLNSIVK